MKNLITLALFIIICNTCLGQIVPRRINYHIIGRDSINLALNEDYNLIEDSCASVVRYGHFNIRTRKFFGNFKDVSRLNPGLVLCEGNYTADGIKDGEFTAHYLNGNMRSKGSFKADQYDGKWEFYYDNGKPQLVFEADASGIKIIEAWDNKGQKTVENGKGTFIISLGIIYWKGKLENGKPDGTWHAMKTDDATNTSMISENYKNGVFKKGNGPTGDYTDASRIVLVSTTMPTYTTAEKMRISPVPCNGTKPKHIVGAQYSNGLASFSENIKDVISPYLSRVDLKSYEETVVFNGEVSDYGAIVKMNTSSLFNQNIAEGIANQLRKLPSLEPATVDGKPVAQKFTITFVFHQGYYSFSYRFLPIKLDK